LTRIEPGIAERFLLDQFPLKHRALLPGILKTARATAATIQMSEPVLQVVSAKQNHGRLISWAVDFGIEKLIQSGRWPVDYRWRSFAQPTGRYLEVRFSHSAMSISQVTDPKVQPRDVRFRQNARLNNQRSFDFFDGRNESGFGGLPAFILVHGKTSLEELEYDFAHVGVPHPDHQSDWIYRTTNIMDDVHTVESDLPPTEQTEIDDDILTFKEELEKWRRDNGED
jgi:hypothetical protein